jgi:hypothetical protein
LFSIKSSNFGKWLIHFFSSLSYFWGIFNLSLQFSFLFLLFAFFLFVFILLILMSYSDSNIFIRGVKFKIYKAQFFRSTLNSFFVSSFKLLRGIRQCVFSN